MTNVTFLVWSGSQTGGEANATLTLDSLRRGILNKVTALIGEEGTPGQRLAFLFANRVFSRT